MVKAMSPLRLARASSTRIPAEITSGPMPSAGMAAIEWVRMDRLRWIGERNSCWLIQKIGTLRHQSSEKVGAMSEKVSTELRVAIAGLGAIGTKIATALDLGIEGLTLSAVAVRDPAKHQAFLAGLRRPPQVMPIEQLGEAADIVVECAPSSQLRAIVEPAV